MHEARVSPGAPEDPLSEITGRELLALLDRELLRLPEKYRAPMVLCCLEGNSGEEAARRLGCSLSTLRRRLAQGRDLLRHRLALRGVTLSSAALSAALLMESTAPGAIPAVLAGSRLSAASLFLAGESTRGTTSEGSAALATGIVRSMVAARLKLVAVTLVILATMVACVGTFVRYAMATPAEDKPLVASAIAADPAVSAPEELAGKDGLGDPLPPGAVARLGTSRLRGNQCQFFPDGRRLVRERAGGDLEIFAVPSGKPLVIIRAKDVPERKGIVGYTTDFTRDGKYLAAVCWEGRCGIWETSSGRLVRWLESGPFYSITHCVFSPDDKLLAVGAGDRDSNKISIGVYEVASGRQLLTAGGSNCAFAPDGRSLITWNGYGYGSTQTARRVAVPGGEELATFSYKERFPDGAPRSDGVWFFEVLDDRSVQVREASTGKVKHTFPGPGENKDAVTYVRHGPGRRELIVIQTRPPGMVCRDLETGKELWQVSFSSPAYFPPLSRDGKTLVTAEKYGRTRVWDVLTGKERTSLRTTPLGGGDDIEISHDGRTVAIASQSIHSSAVSLWDAATGKLLSDLPGHPSAITAAAFAPDGNTAYTIGKDRTLRTWDVATGLERSRVVAEPAEELAVSSDGTELFTGRQNNGWVRVLDSATGRLVREIPVFKRSLVGFAVTAGGTRLVAAGRDGRVEEGTYIRICDAGTGALVREFSRSDSAIEQLAVRLDGGALVTSQVGRRVALWDGMGKKLTEQIGRGERVSAWAKGETPYRIGSVGLSDDGRWLAYSDQEQGIALVDARTGREIGRATPDVYYQNGAARNEVRNVLAFSPDGKTVAWSGVESTAGVFLVEVRSAQVRRQLPGDSYPVQHIAFSPAGSRLLTAGPDGSALIWDLSGRLRGKPGAAPGAERVAGWWDALADNDAAKAYRAMQDMAAHPSAALPLLREKLKPVREVEPAKLNALVARLDGPRFDDREAASRELEALADAAIPYLTRVLQGAPTFEVKRRVEAVLERIEAGRLRPERSVEVLEMIRDGAAQQLLRRCADGIRSAEQTADAARALVRMTRRKVGNAGE
jgi:WD40 repeat protein